MSTNKTTNNNRQLKNVTRNEGRTFAGVMTLTKPKTVQILCLANVINNKFVSTTYMK